MILTERNITITNHNSEIDSPVVLYRGDKNVELKLNIRESKFKFRDDSTSNLIEDAQASYGQLIIETPNEKDPIFSEVTATKKGYIIFTITAEMIDEITEVGFYNFQVRLLDINKQSRATIPPVFKGIEIREPITAEDSNTLNSAVVGLASAANEEVLDTFNADGNYAKTNWKFGDKITAAKLNKAEDGIYQSYALGLNNSSQIKEKADKTTTDDIQHQINQARGQYSTLNDRFNAIDKNISTTQKTVGIVFYDYDSLTWQSGFLNQDGSITENESYYNTKISLLGFNRVVCKKGFGYNSNYPLLLLNSEGQVVRTIYDATDPVVINIEPGEVELRYYYSKNETSIGDIYINIYDDNSIVNGMKNHVDELSSYDFSKLKLNKKIKYTNIKWTPGVFKDGQIDTTIPGFYYAYIDVSGFDKISYNSGNHSYVNPYYNCFFDENKSFISNAEIDTTTNQQCTAQIPYGTKYFGFFTKVDHINDGKMYIELLVDGNKDFEEDLISQLGGVKYNRDNLEWDHHFYIYGDLSNDTSSDVDHYRNCEINTKDFNKVTYVKGFNYFDRYRCCFLDNVRTFISNIMDDEYEIGEKVTVDIPENAYYFCYYTTQPFYEENNISFTLSYNDGLFFKLDEIENTKKAFHERNLLKNLITYHKEKFYS